MGELMPGILTDIVQRNPMLSITSPLPLTKPSEHPSSHNTTTARSRLPPNNLRNSRLTTRSYRAKASFNCNEMPPHSDSLYKGKLPHHVGLTWVRSWGGTPRGTRAILHIHSRTT